MKTPVPVTNRFQSHEPRSLVPLNLVLPRSSVKPETKWLSRQNTLSELAIWPEPPKLLVLVLVRSSSPRKALPSVFGVGPLRLIGVSGTSPMHSKPGSEAHGV